MKNIATKRKNRTGYIYILKSFQYYKIGSAIDAYYRIRGYKGMNPEFEVIGIFKIDKYFEFEKLLHGIFKSKKHRNEWFLLEKNDIKRLKLLCTKRSKLCKEKY